jgi:hypothetical protein
MIARIHVNQHHIRHNKKHPSRAKPVLTVKTYKSNTYTDEVEIGGPSRVVYSPEKPLSCGARVWIECEHEDLNYEEAKTVENDSPDGRVPDGRCKVRT